MTAALKIFRFQPCIFRDFGEGGWSNFFIVMKAERDIWPARSSNLRCDPTCFFTLHPTHTRLAFVDGHVFTPRTVAEGAQALVHRSRSCRRELGVQLPLLYARLLPLRLHTP